jgi:DNA-binding response OmpR family regulator
VVRGKILSVKLQILGMKDWIGFEQSTLIFDLILLDLAMPDFSGFDVIKSLK